MLDLVAENDRVVARYIERGTHTGDFLGLAPPGRSHEKQGFALYRVAHGLLAECWMQEDDQGYQQQLFSRGISRRQRSLRFVYCPVPSRNELHIPGRR